MRRLLLIALVLWATTASAHDFPAERAAVLQLHPTHAELLLIYTEPFGPRVDRLLALYDQNRDGTLDDVELRLARTEVLRRAFAGTSFEAGGAWGAPELNVRRDRSGLSFAVLQRANVTAEGARRMEVRLERRDEVVPLSLIVEPVGVALDGATQERRVDLTAGMSTSARVTTL